MYLHVGRNSKRAMLVSGRINCAVQFCTALPSCANLAGPVRQFLHATAVRAGPHWLARICTFRRALTQPACTSLQKLSFCKLADPSADVGRALSVLQICTAPASRRGAGDLPLAQLCKFIAISVWSRQKCIFTEETPFLLQL